MGQARKDEATKFEFLYVEERRFVEKRLTGAHLDFGTPVKFPYKKVLVGKGDRRFSGADPGTLAPPIAFDITSTG